MKSSMEDQSYSFGELGKDEKTEDFREKQELLKRRIEKFASDIDAFMRESDFFKGAVFEKEKNTRQITSDIRRLVTGPYSLLFQETMEKRAGSPSHIAEARRLDAECTKIAEILIEQYDSKQKYGDRAIARRRHR